MSLTVENVARTKPTPAQRRSERLNLRLTSEEAAIVRQAAAERKQSVTAFVVEAALAARDRALSEDRRLVLANAVFDCLVAEMSEDDEPIEALVQLLKRPRKLELPE